MKQKQNEALGDPTKPVQLPAAEDLLPPGLGDLVAESEASLEKLNPQRDPAFRCPCGQTFDQCNGFLGVVSREELYDQWADVNGKPRV